MDTLKDRLRKARADAKLSQAALAKRIGAGQSTIASIENGRNQGTGAIVQIAKELGVRAEWLADGTLPERAGEAVPEPRKESTSSRPTWPFTRIREDDVRALSPDDRSMVEGALALAIAQVGLKMPVRDSQGLPRRDQAAAIIRDPSTTAANDADYIAIRKVAVKIAAGIAGFDTAQQRDDGTGGSLFLARQWVEKHRYRWQALYATTAKGLSMSPRVKEGDIIVFNTDDTTQQADGVFAVNHEGEFTLKRLKKRLGHWWLYSDNEDQNRYQPVMCSALTFIIGRVVLMQADQL